jgi:hypothetical protein
VGPLGQRGGKGRGVPFRDGALLGLGPNLVLGRIGSPGLFSFLYFFFLFFSDFLICFKFFCKFGSNQFKKIPRTFKYSLQCFKPFRNMFSKQNMILGKSLYLSKEALLT